MKKILLSCIFIVIVFPMFVLGYLLWGPGGVYNTDVRHGKDQTLVIEPGASTQEIVDRLTERQLIKNRYAFYLALLISKQQGKLKAGEFLIPEHARPMDIIQILCCGRVIVHQITFPEGCTVAEVVRHINAQDNLKGGIEFIPPEGMLLPNTYSYVYGETKQSIIDRMYAAMRRNLNVLWKKRSPDLPYQTPEDAVTLASIIEKETGRHDERRRVAGVFVNRLKKGMKLQADPTVIYGITLGKTKLGRHLTRRDLRSETAYNTYLIPGLPPQAIACPGLASLKAAFNPEKSKDLYFVANGRGGHHFSQTYQQHNTYVQLWRNSQKVRQIRHTQSPARPTKLLAHR